MKGETKTFRYDKLIPHRKNFYATNEANERFLLKFHGSKQNHFYICWFVCLSVFFGLLLQRTPKERSVLILVESKRRFQRFPPIFRAFVHD